ncbi:hypothetical protein Tsubulata_040702 [Turnera subulata]|uniref:Uncharacterized protein n=1 Tax=Turnera subulata TaxID=218843 RepID=A0A9Q0FBE0_9ROSI|nr:hypothetical protein Tsubulata_040702 [Turnera subulata]
MATTSLLITSSTPLAWKQSFSISLLPCPRLKPYNPSLISSKPAANFGTSVTLNARASNPHFIFKSFKETRSSTPIFEVDETTSPRISSIQEISSADPFQFLVNRILKTLEALRQPAAAALWIGILLVMHAPSNHLALAASGGRAGGRCSSSYSSRSSSSSKSSGSRSGSYSSGSSSYPSSSKAKSYSTRSPSYSYDDEPRRRSPSVSYSSWSPSYSYPSTQSPKPSTNATTTSTSTDDWAWVKFILIGCCVISLLAAVYYWYYLSWEAEGTSVQEVTSILKLQVGLMGSAVSLQRDLDRICESSDTSSREGLSYLLRGATSALLKHQQYWISGHSSVITSYSPERAEEQFDELSTAERNKFDDETLVNVNNHKIKITMEKIATGTINEYIVVTILVEAMSKILIPVINGNEDLTQALELLKSFPKARINVSIKWKSP